MRTGAVLCLAALLVLTGVGESLGQHVRQSDKIIPQSRADASPQCSAADLDITFHFADDPGDIYRINVVSRNTSGNECILSGSNPPNFVIQMPRAGEHIRFCDACSTPLPGGETPAVLPLRLRPNEVAHQTYRYRTTDVLYPTSESPGAATCVPPSWLVVTPNLDEKHSVLLVSKSLLKPVCSTVDLTGYRPGPPDQAESGVTSDPDRPAIALSADRATYYDHESFSLKANFASLRPVSRSEDCPILLLRQRSPDGNDRFDEIKPPNWCAQAKAASNPTPVQLEFDSGHRSRWSGLGPHLFELFAFDTIEVHQPIRSNPLTLQIADAATIPRDWGPESSGVRTDLTLDKTTFNLGEDIAIHAAVEVVSDRVPVYAEPYAPRGAFFGGIQGSLHLSITDADGPLPGTDTPANLVGMWAGSSGPSACPSPLMVDKPVVFDQSLKTVSLLPTKPGTYQLTLSWSPYHGGGPCLHDPSFSSKPFITVFSKTVTVHIVGTPPPTDIPNFPEFTAWRSKFDFHDTSLGLQTALFDRATGLEWLRPTLASGRGEQQIRAAMTTGSELEGWRFATQEEVLRFLQDFTGSLDGQSSDPAIVRKLIRVLGADAEVGIQNRETGWSRIDIAVRIAGLTPAPDGRIPGGSSVRGYLYHFAHAMEDREHGNVSASIHAAEEGWLSTDGVSTAGGIFLVREAR